MENTYTDRNISLQLQGQNSHVFKFEQTKTHSLRRPFTEHNAYTTIQPKPRRRRSKHVPHHMQPSHLVQKRNARERKRVDAVNDEFTKLRRLIPLSAATCKRISKENILHFSIAYIRGLQRMLREDDVNRKRMINAGARDSHACADGVMRRLHGFIHNASSDNKENEGLQGSGGLVPEDSEMLGSGIDCSYSESKFKHYAKHCSILIKYIWRAIYRSKEIKR